MRRLSDMAPPGVYGVVKSLLDPFPYRRYQDRHRCIFIHIPKNAGTSVIKLLGGNSGRRDHLTYLIFRKANRRKFDSYFKFAIVRNPWDRATSIYNYLRAGGNGKNDRYIASVIADRKMSFQRFIQEYLTPQRLHEHPLFRPQHAFVYDVAGTLQVDHLCRFETISDDIAVVKERLKLKGELPFSNRSRSGDYRQFYQDDAQLIDRISELYSEDVDRLGYSFEPSGGA